MRFGTASRPLTNSQANLAGQTQAAVAIQVRPQVAGRPISDGQVTTVFLAPGYATAIRMPEPINSIVVGDPASCSAEHSDREPQLVFVKPITPKPAQSNLLISTSRGIQVSLLLISRGEPKGDGEADIDFLMRYKPSGQFIVQPAETLSAVVPQTATLAGAALVSGPASAPSVQNRCLRKGSRHPTAGFHQYNQGGTTCS